MQALSFYVATFPASPPWRAVCANTLSWQSTQHTQISRVIAHFLQNVGAPWSAAGLNLTQHCGFSLDVLCEPDEPTQPCCAHLLQILLWNCDAVPHAWDQDCHRREDEVPFCWDCVFCSLLRLLGFYFSR